MNRKVYIILQFLVLTRTAAENVLGNFKLLSRTTLGITGMFYNKYNVRY